MGFFLALFYKDVNDWYRTTKYAKKHSKECEWGWETIPSYKDLNPWETPSLSSLQHSLHS